MLTVVIWVIIVLFIIGYSKNSARKRNVAPGRGQYYESSQDSTGSSDAQRELKERLSPRYARTGQSEILQRARASAEEDFGVEGPAEPSPDIAYIQRAEPEHVTCSRTVNAPEQAAVVWNKNEDLMELVSNIMAKGVCYEMPFERDFVGEGLDLLNRIQL